MAVSVSIGGHGFGIGLVLNSGKSMMMDTGICPAVGIMASSCGRKCIPTDGLMRFASVV